MSSYASLLADTGAKLKFVDTDTGKEYAIGALTQARKAAFEQWLKGNGIKLLLEMKPLVSAAEWDVLYKDFLRDVSAGKYSFHGELSTIAMKTADGAITLAQILMDASGDELTSLISRKGDELQAYISTVLADSAPDEGNGEALPPKDRRKRRS